MDFCLTNNLIFNFRDVKFIFTNYKSQLALFVLLLYTKDKRRLPNSILTTLWMCYYFYFTINTLGSKRINNLPSLSTQYQIYLTQMSELFPVYLVYTFHKAEFQNMFYLNSQITLDISAEALGELQRQIIPKAYWKIISKN